MLRKNRKFRYLYNILCVFLKIANGNVCFALTKLGLNGNSSWTLFIFGEVFSEVQCIWNCWSFRTVFNKILKFRHCRTLIMYKEPKGCVKYLSRLKLCHISLSTVCYERSSTIVWSCIPLGFDIGTCQSYQYNKSLIITSQNYDLAP